MTKERESQLRDSAVTDPMLRDALAEIDRLHEENDSLWQATQQMTESYHALKGQLAKAREALPKIELLIEEMGSIPQDVIRHGWLRLLEAARQALKETE